MCVICIILIGVGCKSEASLFNKKEQKELKDHQEALLGQWVINNEEKTEGKILLDFAKTDGEGVVLKIDNEPVSILAFRMIGGLNFVIQFKRKDGQESQLLGQFKSYNRKSLMVMNMEEVFNIETNKSLALHKLKMETELTVSIDKNR